MHAVHLFYHLCECMLVQNSMCLRKTHKETLLQWTIRKYLFDSIMLSTAGTFVRHYNFR